MARTKSSWEQALQAILTGAATGAQTGQASGREIEKALMLEKLKQAMQLESQRSLISQFGGAGKAKYSIGPSGLTATPMTSKELLEEQEANELLGGIGGQSSIAEKRLAQKVAETQAVEGAKPYTDIIANKISTVESIVPKIDELLQLIEKPGNIFGAPLLGGLTGASRIGAAGKEGPWQAFKMGTTMGKGREAAVLLKDIRELAFGKGGKTLSENEAAIALSAIDPSYKTEIQWINGLKSARRDLLRGKELVTKPGSISNKPSPLLKPPTNDIDSILEAGGFSPQEIEAYKRGQ